MFSTESLFVRELLYQAPLLEAFPTTCGPYLETEIWDMLNDEAL
jgi:hypothetical protein